MAAPSQVYDSAATRRPVVSELGHLWSRRSLIRLLVSRDLTVRYKRSWLGVWWTLLNPLLMILVFWLVFANLFQRSGGDVPYIVYVSSGILLAQFFSQGVIASGSAIVGARGILAKVHVPPEVFSVSAAIAAAANFVFSLLALIVIMFLTGTSLTWQWVGMPITIISMLLLVAGAGLIVASAAVWFYDVFDLVRVLAMLVTYASATFYPIDIIPEKYRWLFELNPIYHHVTLFRTFAYGGEATWVSFAVVIASGIVMLAVGVWVFSRSWKSVIASM